MEIRTLEAHEVRLHREVRLRALQEAPDSFGEGFADIAAGPMSYWDALTHSVTDAGRHVMYVLCEGEAVVGCVYGLVDRERSDGGRVGGMWVDPAWRRRGPGGALLEAVVTWARGRGFRRLGLGAPAQSPQRWRSTAAPDFARQDLERRCPRIRRSRSSRWNGTCDATTAFGGALSSPPLPGCQDAVATASPSLSFRNSSTFE